MRNVFSYLAFFSHIIVLEIGNFQHNNVDKKHNVKQEKLTNIITQI